MGWWNRGRAATIEAATIQMKCIPPKPRRVHLFALVLLMTTTAGVFCQDRRPAALVSSPSENNVAQFVSQLREKTKALERSSGMRLGFQSFTSAHKLAPESVRYSDYVLVRLLFEATRDAGFWSLHWATTDQPPNSDRIWKQWQSVTNPSPLQSTATAECDELSALYAFLVSVRASKVSDCFGRRQTTRLLFGSCVQRWLRLSVW